jgi:hypothetical protein
MTIPPAVGVGIWVGLSVLQVWGLNLDRKKKLSSSPNGLKRDLYFHIAVLVACFGCSLAMVKLENWAFFPYMLLTGIRATLQARRERQAWKMAIVQNIMES